MRDIDELIKRMRPAGSEIYNVHVVQTSDILALCTAVESAVPSLDLLQKRLEAGCEITNQDGLWWLFDRRGEGITSGETLRSMLLNLMWIDTGDGSTE